MQVKKFTCMTKLFHVCEIKFTCTTWISHAWKKVHMHEKIVLCMLNKIHMQYTNFTRMKKSSHAWKKFSHALPKFHMLVKKFTCMKKRFHMHYQNFTCLSKSSHACETLKSFTCMWISQNFTWFHVFTHFSHAFHMIFTHILLVVSVSAERGFSTSILGGNLSQVGRVGSVSRSSLSHYWTSNDD